MNFVWCGQCGLQVASKEQTTDTLIAASWLRCFLSQGNRPDGIPGRVVILKQTSILQVFHHVLPLGISIRYGFSGLRVRELLDSFRFYSYLHRIHDRIGQFLAFRLSFIIWYCISCIYAVSGSDFLFCHLLVFIQAKRDSIYEYVKDVMPQVKTHEQQLRLLGDILSALSVDKLIYAKGRIWFLKE